MSSLTIFALREVRAYMTAKPWRQIIAEKEGFETFSSPQTGHIQDQFMHLGKVSAPGSRLDPFWKVSISESS